METIFNNIFLLYAVYAVIGFGAAMLYGLLGRIAGKYVVAAIGATSIVLWNWEFSTDCWVVENRAVLKDFEKNFFLKIFWLPLTVIVTLPLAGGIVRAVVRLLATGVKKIVKFCW